jgi:hypothetical protein
MGQCLVVVIRVFFEEWIMKCGRDGGNSIANYRLFINPFIDVGALALGEGG